MPQPPNINNYRAVDINNGGVIAGDGGFDGGEAWRLADGSYEMLGTLGTDPVSNSAGINEGSDIAGVSKTFTISDPPDAFIDSVVEGMSLVLASSQAAYINDSRQVVGWTTSLTGFRHTPGRRIEYLPSLGDRSIVIPSSINVNGDVVGTAKFPNGSGEVPFLFTDSGGMQAIGNFSGSASGDFINDLGQVIGELNLSGGPNPWIWSEDQGVRFLGELIDPEQNINLLSVRAINNNGQIIGHGQDLMTGDTGPVLLTPMGDGGEDGGDAPSEAAVLESFTVQQGTHTGGDIPDLLGSDDSYLLIASEANGTRNSTSLLINAISSLSTISRLDLTVELGVDSTGVKGQLLLRNFQTGRWDKFALTADQQDSKSVIADIPNPQDYLDDGLITLGVLTRSRTPHEARIDHVVVTVTQ